MPAAIEYVKAGQLHALAVTIAARAETLSEFTTVGEFVPGFEASTWYGIGVSRNTPAEIVDQLNKEFNAALADPKIKKRLIDLGGREFGGSPADFGKVIVKDTEKWAR